MRTQAEEENSGICALTKKYGLFARSHIIPSALTLVIREGEKILEEIDTKAIMMLRKHRLIWSSWGTNLALPTNDTYGSPNAMNFRPIYFDDPSFLQLFFLSLVWRAAASQRPEMTHTHLPENILEDIRKKVLTKSIADGAVYPIILYQITSRGMSHNRTPFVEEVNVINKKGFATQKKATRIRLYFDGLIAHVYIFKNKASADPYIPMSIGNGKNGVTLVFGQSYEYSRENADMKLITNLFQK
jgi:hypothetical protein